MLTSAKLRGSWYLKIYFLVKLYIFFHSLICWMYLCECLFCSFVVELFAVNSNAKDNLSQYPGWIYPGKFPSENMFRKITPRRKTFGFFTSPTILNNLFHYGKNTVSLIVLGEFLHFAQWVLKLFLWYYWYYLVCGNISLEWRQCEVTLLPEF